MQGFREQTIRALLLGLLMVLGPLSAQSVYACALMGDVHLEECCCDDHASGHIINDAESASCCDAFVEVRVDNDSNQLRTDVKKADGRSDADPPSAIVVSSDIIDRAYDVSWYSVTPWHESVDLRSVPTYLATQRLRI